MISHLINKTAYYINRKCFYQLSTSWLSSIINYLFSW